MANKEFNKEVRYASNEHGALTKVTKSRCFQEARHLLYEDSLRGMSVSWFFHLLSPFMPGLLI